MTEALNPNVCPTCGEPNLCGLSQGQERCWCFDVLIPEAAQERIPLAAKNLACICARCAAASEASKTAS
jgi:hypothetical protein